MSWTHRACNLCLSSNSNTSQTQHRDRVAAISWLAFAISHTNSISLLSNIFHYEIEDILEFLAIAKLDIVNWFMWNTDQYWQQTDRLLENTTYKSIRTTTPPRRNAALVVCDKPSLGKNYDKLEPTTLRKSCRSTHGSVSDDSDPDNDSRLTARSRYRTSLLSSAFT